MTSSGTVLTIPYIDTIWQLRATIIHIPKLIIQKFAINTTGSAFPFVIRQEAARSLNCSPG